MKRARSILISGLLAMAGLAASAQSKLELVFTNQSATFTDLQGRNFANAELIRANATELIFKTNGDYGIVALSNVAPATLETIGIPADFLARAKAQAEQREQAASLAREQFAAEQRRLLEPNDLTDVAILSLPPRAEADSLYGPVYLCNVRLTNGAEVKRYVARIPPKVAVYFAQRQQLEQSIAQQSNQVAFASAELTYNKAQLNERQHHINVANAAAPIIAGGDPYYTDMQRSVANIAQANLDHETTAVNAKQDLLVEMSSQLGDAQSQLDQITRNEPVVVALLSRYAHNGIPMVICAPDHLQTTNRANAATPAR